jgi:hypothetical protein
MQKLEFHHKERIWVVLENKVQWRIFRPGREVVMTDWKKLHNEELHSLYSSPNIIWINI